MDTLTPREKEIIQAFVANGCPTNSNLGKLLYVGERTIDQHLQNAKKKLGLPNRAALAYWAAKEGF